MLYLDLLDALKRHDEIIEQSGGASGVRDLGALESALAQPQMTFAGQELYPTLIEKASALGFSIINNHSFVDGNKRIGHALLENFLVINGYQLEAEVDEQERVILAVAAGQLGRDEFTEWIGQHIIKKTDLL